jgi:hypothetical protein
MTWNYRLVKRSWNGQVMYGIHSAYYTDGKLDGLSENPLVLGYLDAVDEIEADLSKVAKAMKLPIVEYETLKEVKSDEVWARVRQSEIELMNIVIDAAIQIVDSDIVENAYLETDMYARVRELQSFRSAQTENAANNP